MTEVRVPEIGENIESGDVIKVLVAEGDLVEVDQPLAEIETDKAVLEIPSPAKGRVEKILIAAGDTIKIGQVIMHIAADGDGSQQARGATESTAPAASAHPTPEPAPKARQATKTTSVNTPSQAPASAPARAASVPAAPAVRRLARELGVDLAAVSGTGAGGRITTDDVKAHVQAVMSRGTSPGAAHFTSTRSDDVTREPLSRVRQITAENMTRSWTTIPHVTQHDRADITGLEAFRRKNAAQVEAQGGKLTVTAILLRVCATALKVYPRFNSSIDTAAQELVLHKTIHIGVAVDTERGLLVPVVRDADQKSLTRLAAELGDLAARTRDKKVKPDELSGGTFTISNLGGIGGTGFTPIVYAPQVAILGVARTQKELQLIDGQSQERLFLPLSLSYDHRVIDGADGARFLHWIVDALENPYLAVLGA